MATCFLPKTLLILPSIHILRILGKSTSDPSLLLTPAPMLSLLMLKLIVAMLLLLPDVAVGLLVEDLVREA